MRRPLLALLVPVIAAAVTAPSVAATADASPLAAKRPTFTTTSPTQQPVAVASPTGRRWN